MNLKRLALLLMLTALPACTKKAAPAAEKASKESDVHADETPHETLPKLVKLPPRVVADAGIRTVAVVREALSATLNLPGELSADPDRSARISSPLAGRIVDVSFREGSVVAKGEALARIRIPELGKVRGAYTGILAKANAARSNSDRLSGLVDKGLASKQEVTQAQAEANALESEASALREQLGALGGGGQGPELTLRAPVAGVVISRDAVVGQPIGTEQTIATIADLREVWFLGRVFEKDLGRLQVGAKAEVALNAYPNEHFTGTVEYIGRQVDTVTRTVTARVKLANRGDLLRLGLFGAATVSVNAEASAPTLVVPRSALVDVADKTVVFVRHADGDFEMHQVVVGRSALGKVEIISGLREGEQVVDEGAFTLKSAVLRGTLKDDD